MSEKVTYAMDPLQADPIGANLRSNIAPSARAIDQPLDWSRDLSSVDCGTGNPCLGIAIGCGLSLIVWGGLLMLFFAVR